ncbi:MAG: hypothetical protein ACE5E9_02435 [Nitrospinaceae bacterium]
MYLLTQSLVDHQSLGYIERVGAGDPEGEKYSKYGIGTSLLAVPFYLSGKVLARWLDIDPSYATAFCVSMVNAMVTALTCVLMFRFGRERFGFSSRTSSLLALGFGLSTIAWFHSEDFMSEPATTLALLASVFLATGRPGEKQGQPTRAGIFFALALTCRLATLVALPGFLIHRFMQWREGAPPSLRGRVLDLTRILVPVGIALALIGLYNYVRFQDFLETGYEKGFGSGFVTGLWGLLFSPGKSVFLYNPLLIPGCVALPVLFRTRPAWAGLFGWIVLSHLLLFSFWHSWFGGMGWGPRLMLVVLPYLILPVGFLLERRDGVLRRLVIFSILVGIIIQIPSVTVSVSRYYYDLRNQFGEKAEDLLVYSPAYSPLIMQPGEMKAVFRKSGDRRLMERLVSEALSGRRFLGAGDREVLEKGLAVNAPNFWWYYMYLFGFPWYMTWLPPGLLLSLALVCGYKIYFARAWKPVPDAGFPQ